MDRKTPIRQHLTEARQLLLEAVAALDDETALLPTTNPEWRVRDILAHLAASERGLLRNVERFLAGGELPADFSLDVWNRRQVAKRRDATIADLLAELAASRAEVWAMLDRLDEADLDVPGTHPAGMRTTVAGLFYTIANHELDHGNEIRVALGLPIVRQADWRQAFRESP
ncbi:MAG: DinB family protein [Anaerolineae bacterium]|nr:DinB family protein [Caldilineales bacterium]MDW8268487.1 DinB family protein [Anaerolineae bacterium]